MSGPPSIPSSINSLSMREAAGFYRDQLGWAVHPLYGPDRGKDHERGKKPLLKGWPAHTRAQTTDEFLTKHFSNGTTHNVGCVVRPPFVHVDLDSKADKGQSVQQWLLYQPHLVAVPRERTGGGGHLTFICRDVPEQVLRSDKALQSRINEAVTAELFFDGLSITLSPSTHKSGHTYSWEVTGEIPEVKWADLCRWFGFAPPEPKKRGRQAKEKPWWSQWNEDLRTLDLISVLKELEMLGDCLDADTCKWSMRCPWESEHTGGAADAPGSDTAVFNSPGQSPGFRCLHGHCSNRIGKDLLEWIEKHQPGLIAKHCTNVRVWTPGSAAAEGKVRILLPTTGRSHSDFAAELGQTIGPALDLFRFGDTMVEIIPEPANDASAALTSRNRLSVIKPAHLVTAVERTVETGVLRPDDAGDQVFLPKSMAEHDARIVLASQAFTFALPRINRVLDVSIPMGVKGGRLLFSKKGYDPDFYTWLDPNAPELRSIGFEEAKALLFEDLLAGPEQGGFWWHDFQDRIHALARLLTPYCRGLMGWRRGPLWIFDGNREGCGKDTCADVTHLIYTGRSIISAPLAKDSDEEMRKRITAALLAGSRFFHLANMKGHIRFAALEAATDNSGVWTDRKLGVSEEVSLPNEADFSFSANNATWEPDIERRSRRIRLRFTPEDVNGHKYRHSNLREWILERRGELLSAVHALVVHWVELGCPAGPTPFTSFPEWGSVVGGILHAGNLGDPCRRHEDSLTSGDQNTRAMREFFVAAHEKLGADWVLKAQLHKFVLDAEEVQDLFEWIDFKERRGLISFGKLLAKYDSRELGGIVFNVDRSSKNYCKYRFSRPEDTPIPPNGSPQPASDSVQNCGMWDVVGHSHHAATAKEKCTDDSKKEHVLSESPQEGVENVPLHPTSHSLIYCRAKADLQRVAENLTGKGHIALDLETYGSGKAGGLDPWRGEIRLLTLRGNGGPVWIIDLMAVGYDLGPLVTILESVGVIAHNAKFDLLWLRVKCGLRISQALCTLTASRLLCAGTKPGNNLDQCLDRYLGVAPGKDLSRSDWGSPLLSEDQIAYAARDVVHLHDLSGAMGHEIEFASLGEVWSLETALLPCVVDMEAAGIRVDVEKLKEIEAKACVVQSNACLELRDALDLPALNPNSPNQLQEALRAIGIKVEGTSEGALKMVNDDKIIPLILGYREATKLAQQSEGLIRHVKHDGRIHARFEPTGAVTGRFSSKGPNLQNIGKGEMREAFIPAPGHKLVVADYSQIELRAAGAIAGESKMIDAFGRGVDLHRLTASAVLGKAEDTVTPQDRQLAKAVNFGLLYGQSARGLVSYAATAYGVTLSEDEAGAVRHAFFSAYNGLRRWHSQSWKDAQSGVSEVRTRLGRRRLLPEDASAWARFSACVNTPVQGGCADGMKKAIILLADRLPEGSRILSSVHDELIVESPNAIAESVRDIMDQTMREAMEKIFLEVPIEVEAHVCDHWGEK